MIRVYSANFNSDDLLFIANTLRAGCGSSFGSRPCYECDRIRACMALYKAAEHCEKKAAEMVEP